MAPRASAFCRATTCDPADPSANCERDDEHCLITGKPLFWASSCVPFSVQADGSRRHDVSYDELVSLTEAAFAIWLDVECEGGSPGLRVVDAGPAECGASEYNKDKRNAYVVLFRDDDWPYLGAEDTLGLTTLRFDTETGSIYDADIEINGTENITVGDSEVQDDLASILTHEVGHFLGLSHTLSPKRPCWPAYHTGSVANRALEQDDVDGVCSIYPPDRKANSASCEPRHGFASECGPFEPSRRSQPRKVRGRERRLPDRLRNASRTLARVAALLGSLLLASYRRMRARNSEKGLTCPCISPYGRANLIIAARCVMASDVGGALAHALDHVVSSSLSAIEPGSVLGFAAEPQPALRNRRSTLP